MAITTNYDILVNYRIKNKAAGQLRKMTDEAGRLNNKAKAAGSSLGLLGKGFLALGGFLAVKKGISAVIGINKELQDTQAQIRSILQLNLGGSFAKNTDRARVLLSQFRKDAAQTPGTFKDLANFSKDIAGSITRAGGGMEELRSITKGGVVAASLFGERADVAARDIRQALSGTLGAKDIFAQAILVPFLQTKGVAKDHAKVCNEIAKRTPEKALMLLNEAFQQGAIKDAAKAFENSFSGVATTLQSSTQEFLELVGKPLFGEIIKQIKLANKFFEKNQKAVKDFAKTVGSALASAFRVVLDTFKFIAEHKGILLKVAGAFLALKGLKGLAGGLAGLGGKGGLGLGAIGVTAAVATTAATFVDQKQDEKLDLADRLFALQKAARQQEVTRAQAQGTIRGGSVEFGSARNLLEKAIGLNLDVSKKVSATLVAKRVGLRDPIVLADLAKGKAANQSAKAVMEFTHQLNFAILTMGDTFKQFQQKLELKKINEELITAIKKSGELAKGGKTQPKAPGANVGKVVINVASDDPDRMAMGIEGMFQNLVLNPTQALSTAFEG